MDVAQDFDAREYVEAAIEPSAVWHGIHVAADEQCFFGFTAQREPSISRGIVMNFQREADHFLAQPPASFEPRIGEGHALSAVDIPGERAQFLEFSDGAFGI
jgi:hypothetical protein